jgi:hypothetical protein
MKRAGTAILLISGLAAAGLWLQPEAPPRGPEPDPLPAPALDPRDAPHLLEQFMARHEKAAVDAAGPRFDLEMRTGITEARLLALALPEAMGPLLERVASDPVRPGRNREFAIRILGYLPDAEPALVRLASRSETALRTLCGRDLRGDHLSLYVAAGDAEALSHWIDPAAAAALKRLAALSDEARRMAERHDLLRAPDWALQLEDILVDPCHERSDLTLWALHVARSRALPGLASLLRDRLDSETPDDFRDDVLVALSDLEGELTEGERSRLESFGYLGDPAARLRKFLVRR